jgi:hypothetical protein
MTSAVSIENNFAAGIGSISAGFDQQILGQASYINQLQNGGAFAPPSFSSQAQPQLAQPQLGGTPAQIVAQLEANPALVPAALDALRQNPELVKTALLELRKQPHLAARLPAPIKDFLAGVLRSIGGGGCAA